MGYIIFFILISGCISNPKYTTASHFEKDLKDYPQSEKQIRENQRESYYTHNTASRVSSGMYYTVSEKKNGSFGFGGENDPFWIGYENIKYRHQVIVTIVCKNNEYPALESRFSNKAFKWKISEKFKGDGVTNLSGEGQFSFETNDSKKFESVKLVLNNQVYSVPLQGLIRLEVEPENCN